MNEYSQVKTGERVTVDGISGYQQLALQPSFWWHICFNWKDWNHSQQMEKQASHYQQQTWKGYKHLLTDTHLTTSHTHPLPLIYSLSASPFFSYKAYVASRALTAMITIIRPDTWLAWACPLPYQRQLDEQLASSWEGTIPLLKCRSAQRLWRALIRLSIICSFSWKTHAHSDSNYEDILKFIEINWVHTCLKVFLFTVYCTLDSL